MSDNDAEFDSLQNFARAHGLFAQIHKNFDPSRQPLGREHACWYLQRSKKQNPTVAPHEPTILKFATADEIYRWIDQFKKSEASNA